MAAPRSIRTISAPCGGGRRRRLAASTVPENPAPTITKVFRILGNSTKATSQKIVRETCSSANIPPDSWSNSAFSKKARCNDATQQIQLLLRFRRLSDRGRGADGDQFPAFRLA